MFYDSFFFIFQFVSCYSLEFRFSDTKNNFPRSYSVGSNPGFMKIR